MAWLLQYFVVGASSLALLGGAVALRNAIAPKSVILSISEGSYSAIYTKLDGSRLLRSASLFWFV